MAEHSEQVQRLLQWIEHSGGYFHPNAHAQIDPETGLSVFARADLPAEERLISCPFDIAITPEQATQAVCDVRKTAQADLVWPAESSKAGEAWNGRMRIAAYLGLHWAHMEREGAVESSLNSHLRHWPYIAALPAPADLLTPLYFTESELELLHGSNLHGAVLDRRREWGSEWMVVRAGLKEDGLTWDRYLAAATYLSSRAFPSKLLHLPDTGSSSTSAIQTSAEKESHPVLLPGVDLFNHARGQPITWLSSITPSTPSGSTKTISLVTAQAQTNGDQLFNNYGPKPNEELLLAYGFVIEDNPDDVVMLKVGAAKASSAAIERLEKSGLDAGKRCMLRRDGKLDPDLLAIMRILISPDFVEDIEIDSEDEHALHEHEEKSMQLELDVLSTLGQMLDDKLEKLEVVPEVEARDEVRRMCEIYRRGQVDILNTALEKIEERVTRLEGMMDQGMGGCACCA